MAAQGASHEVAVPWSGLGLRISLFAGAVASVLLASWLSGLVQPPADAELTRLLKGMAFIKYGLVLTAMAGVAWRVVQPISPRLAAVYLVCAWVAVAATTLIWHLAFVAFAAVAFHAAELVFLVAAYRDLGPFAARR